MHTDSLLCFNRGSAMVPGGLGVSFTSSATAAFSTISQWQGTQQIKQCKGYKYLFQNVYTNMALNK